MTAKVRTDNNDTGLGGPAANIVSQHTARKPALYFVNEYRSVGKNIALGKGNERARSQHDLALSTYRPLE